MFKNADNLAKLAPAPVRPVVEPYKPLVVAAGFQAAHTIAIQVTISRHKGVTNGAKADLAGSKFHRLEVTRMVDYDQCDDNAFAWLKTKLGPKRDDRMLRKDERHTLVMYNSQHGVKDLKPWMTMFREVSRSIHWCYDTLLQGGDDHYALVMLVSVTEWELKTPANYDPYYEAIIRGISDLEVVRLAKEPNIELPDGFEGQTFDSPDGDPVDFVNAPVSSFVER